MVLTPPRNAGGTETRVVINETGQMCRVWSGRNAGMLAGPEPDGGEHVRQVVEDGPGRVGGGRDGVGFQAGGP